MDSKKRRCSLGGIYLITVAALINAVLWGSRAVTVLSEQLPINRNYCFVIDAGHGGEDGGAVSCTGIPESSINLEISVRLEDLLHFLGYETNMIRRTDTAVYTKGETLSQKKVSDLKERVRIANEIESAILLSIHQNNFPDSRYSGAQVFHNGKEESRQLASRIQEAFLNTVNPVSHREIKQAAGVYLMDHIRCTGVLIECGFLSNPEEERKLRSPEYQKDLICAIACAAIAYTNT